MCKYFVLLNISFFQKTYQLVIYWKQCKHPYPGVQNSLESVRSQYTFEILYIYTLFLFLHPKCLTFLPCILLILMIPIFSCHSFSPKYLSTVSPPVTVLPIFQELYHVICSTKLSLILDYAHYSGILRYLKYFWLREWIFLK